MFSGFPPWYQNKLQGKGVQDVVNLNKTKFESYGDLVDQNLIDNQDSQSQTENNETPVREHPNESDSEEGETSETSVLPSFMTQILPDDEITVGISKFFKFKAKRFAQCCSYMSQR